MNSLASAVSFKRVKDGIYVNRSEIWSTSKTIVRLKCVGNTTRQLTPRKRSPGWWGTVWYPSTNFTLQMSIKSSIFHIFLNLPYPLKKSLFPKMPRNRTDIYPKPPNSSYGYKHRDLALLET